MKTTTDYNISFTLVLKNATLLLITGTMRDPVIMKFVEQRWTHIHISLQLDNT